MVFTAADLHYRDYRISEPYPDGDKRISGPLDDTPVDRLEEQEILYVINACYERWNWPPYTKAPGRKIELLIRRHIPPEVITQRGILDWIRTHWRHYWQQLPGG